MHAAACIRVILFCRFEALEIAFSTICEICADDAAGLEIPVCTKTKNQIWTYAPKILRISV